MICKKLRPNSESTKSDLVSTLAAPKNSGNKCCEQNLGQRTAHYQKWVQISAGNVDQALISVLQRQNSPYFVLYPVGTQAEDILQLQKSYVDQLVELFCTGQDPAESVEVVHCFMTRTRNTFLLLNPRFHYSMDLPLQVPE